MNLKKIADNRYAYLEQVEDGKFRNAMLGAAMGASMLGGMTSCGDDPLEDEPQKVQTDTKNNQDDVNNSQQSDIIDDEVTASKRNGIYYVTSQKYPIDSIALALRNRGFEAEVKVPENEVKTNATPSDLKGIFTSVIVKNPILITKDDVGEFSFKVSTRYAESAKMLGDELKERYPNNVTEECTKPATYHIKSGANGTSEEMISETANDLGISFEYFQSK